MKFSETFHFLIILKESLKLIFKTWKIMAPIAALSLLIPSLLFLLFASSYQSIMNHPQSSSIYFLIFLAIEIAVIMISIPFFGSTTVAIISAAASSYVGNTSSLSDLFSTAKRKWRTPRRAGKSMKQSFYAVLVGVLTAAAVIMDMINPFTICLLILLWIGLFIFSMKSSIVNCVSMVVCVVEDGCEGNEAMERAEGLVEGKKLDGFMLSLFFNVLILICFLVSWMVLGDKGEMNFVIYGLIFVNFVSLLRIVILMGFTVLYFECKRERGEEEILYAKLPASPLPLSNDVV